MPRRDLVARRTPARRWTRRIVGILATAAMLAVGAVAASMILSPDDDEVAAQTAPGKGAEKAKEKERGREPDVEREDAAAEAKRERRSGPSRKQRRQERAAVEEVRAAGYEPMELAAYHPSQTLRVLVGRPREGTTPGLKAFFFARGRYLGNDALSSSMELDVGRQRDREITLVYGLFVAGDRPCCPSGGDAEVRFRWTGDELEPRDEIPADLARKPLGVT
jgi:hypothetical protein